MVTIATKTISIVIDNSQSRTVIQRPRPDDNYLPYADSASVAADMLLRHGVDRVRLGVTVAAGQNEDAAMKEAGREVKKMMATGGSYFA